MTSAPETTPDFHSITPNEKMSEMPLFLKTKVKDFQNYLKNKCNGWKDTNINIGVIGQSHSGKSSFINTIRGLKSGDKGAATVRNLSCTKEPTPYEYPNNSLVKLWDLPGVGTTKFPMKTYMDKINVSR